MTRRLRALAVAASVVAAGAALALVAAPAAEAHSVLVGSTPSEGETLDTLPAEFSVSFNETLLAGAGGAAFALRVLGPDGLYYGDGCLSIVDATMSTTAAIGPAGDYTLEYQVVSADGHPVSGEIAFSWTGQATAEGSTAPSVCADTTPTGTPTPGDTASGPPLADLAWIAAALLAIAAAVGVALVAMRRRPRG
ncbi:MAG: copper resistance protein CopC [Protaetiibacter sp.]